VACPPYVILCTSSGGVLDKKRAQSAQILYYSVSRCMKKDVDKEKMMWLVVKKHSTKDDLPD
jgi:hypothetical protein